MARPSKPIIEDGRVVENAIVTIFRETDVLKGFALGILASLIYVNLFGKYSLASIKACLKNFYFDPDLVLRVVEGNRVRFYDPSKPPVDKPKKVKRKKKQPSEDDTRFLQRRVLEEVTKARVERKNYPINLKSILDPIYQQRHAIFHDEGRNFLTKNLLTKIATQWIEDKSNSKVSYRKDPDKRRRDKYLVCLREDRCLLYAKFTSIDDALTLLCMYQNTLIEDGTYVPRREAHSYHSPLGRDERIMLDYLISVIRHDPSRVYIEISGLRSLACEMRKIFDTTILSMYQKGIIELVLQNNGSSDPAEFVISQEGQRYNRVMITPLGRSTYSVR